MRPLAPKGIWVGAILLTLGQVVIFKGTLWVDGLLILLCRWISRDELPSLGWFLLGGVVLDCFRWFPLGITAFFYLGVWQGFPILFRLLLIKTPFRVALGMLGATVGSLFILHGINFMLGNPWQLPYTMLSCGFTSLSAGLLWKILTENI